MTRLLLDTQVVIAIVENRRTDLSISVQDLLADSASVFIASVASLWEIAIKVRIGKLPLRTDLHVLPDTLKSYRIGRLAVEAAHVLHDLQPLPPTRDPFDRLLLAQCAVEGMRLVTLVRALAAHPLAWRAA